MANEINNIVINITSSKPVGQKGFGGILVLGTSARGEYMQATIGSGTSGLVWKASETGNKYIAVEYVDPASADQSLSVARTGSGTSADPYLITVSLATDSGSNLTSTAAQIKTAAEAVANVAGASAIVTLTLVQAPGDGLVSAVSETDLTAVSDPASDLKTVSSLDDMIAEGYLSTSPEYLLVSSLLSQEVKPAEIQLFQISSYANLATEVAALINAGYSDWYHMLIASRDKADILTAMSYISTHERMGYFCTADQTIASETLAGNCLVMVHNQPETYPEAALVGYCAPQPIGSLTWDSVPLTGIPISALTETEKNTLLDAHVNIIGKMGGVNVSWAGTLGDGNYVDVRQGRDWLAARLREAWWFLKINNSKVEMTMRGVRQIEAAFRSVFAEAGRAGIISRVYTDEDRAKSDLGDYKYQLVMPQSIDEIPAADRAARIIRSISFKAYISGGVNEIEVNGSLEV